MLRIRLLAEPHRCPANEQPKGHDQEGVVVRHDLRVLAYGHLQDAVRLVHGGVPVKAARHELRLRAGEPLHHSWIVGAHPLADAEVVELLAPGRDRREDGDAERAAQVAKHVEDG